MLFIYLLVLLFTSCRVSGTDQNVLTEGSYCAEKLKTFSSNPTGENENDGLMGQNLVEPSKLGVLSTPAPDAQSSSFASAGCDTCAGRDPSQCPVNGTLGIRYGRCYTLSDLMGNPITRAGEGAGTYYHFGTLESLRTLIFRICRGDSKASCASSQNENVPEGGTWFLLDQSGHFSDQVPQFVGATTYYLIITNSYQSSLVVDFTAKIRCLFGKCTPCVRLNTRTGGLGDSYVGLIPVFWAGLGDGIMQIPSPSACHPIIFQETACLSS